MSSSVGQAWAELLKGRSYGEKISAQFLNRFLRSPYIKLLRHYADLPENARVLEPGCGSGKFSLAFVALGNHAFVFDYSFEVLREVRISGYSLYGDSFALLSSFCCGDIETLPFRDNAFDLVFNEGVVEHWLDDASRLRVMKEMVRVTKQGGAVAVIVPNGSHPLIKVWERELEGFKQAPPMTYYSAKKLETDLIDSGLRDVYTDGIYPWRSWFRTSLWDRFYLIGAFLDRFVTLPKVWREKWAINLIGMGRKS